MSKLLNRYNVLKIIKFSIILITTLVTYIAIEINEYNLKSLNELNKLGFVNLLFKELNIVTIASLISFLSLFYFYSKRLFKSEMRFSYCFCILSFIYSIFILLGKSFSTFSDFTFVGNSLKQILISIIILIGLTILLYNFIGLLNEKIFSKNFYRPKINFKFIKLLEKASDKEIIIVSSCVIFLSWLILALPFLPGSVPFDGRRQLLGFLGYRDINLIDPYFSSLIMSILYKIGYFILSSPSGATLFYITFQSILGALIFGSVTQYIWKVSKSISLFFLAIVFYSINPVWFSYSQAILKDTLFYMFFTLYVLESTKFLSSSDKRALNIMTFSAVFCCLFRYGSILIFTPSYLFFLIILKESRRQIGISLFSLLFIYILLNQIILPACGLKYDHPQEAATFPVQQVSRLVIKQGDKLSKADMSKIEKLLKLEKLKTYYNPEYFDDVKNFVLKKANKKDILEFSKVWIKNGIKYPKTYAESALNHMYGYFYPFYFSRIRIEFPLHIQKAFKKDEPSNRIVLSKYYFSKNSIREIVISSIRYAQKIPIISFLLNPAFYTWILFYSIFIIIYARKFNLFSIYIAPIMVLLYCFASPLNGLIRFMLPIMSTVPLLLAISIVKSWGTLTEGG